MLRFAWWKNFIVTALLTLFLTVPAWADGMPDTGGPAFTDYGSFLGEYQAAGAFKFYDNTEALLRMAQFELSLMRYRFLKGQIQRKGDYRGLVQMVDLRLRFLKKQMHLTNTDIAAIPPRKARIPKVKKAVVKPPAEKEKPAAAKPGSPGAADKDKAKAKAVSSVPGVPPAVVVIPPPGKAAVTLPGTPPVTSPGTSPVKPGATPAASPATTPAAPAGTPQAAPPGTPQVVPPAATEKPPDVVVTDTPTTKEDGKTEEEKEKVVKPPPPPPSFWEKLKIRLHLKKKAAEAS